MAIYIISYDLRQPGRDYEDLYRALETFPHIHPLESCWLISTSDSAVQIRDYLSSRMDSNDKLLVISAGDSAAWRFLSVSEGLWLQEYLKVIRKY